MKTNLKILTLILITLITLPVAASHQQLGKKARELAAYNKSQEILRIASSIGADVSNVKIKLEQRGKIIKLTGNVPSSNDLARVVLAVESVGQFKDTRNFVKVVQPKVDDGIVVRKVDYVHAEHIEGLPCPTCESGDKCDALYKEWQDLNKKISKYVVRRYSKNSNVYKRSAQSLINQLLAVQEKLDASLCFEPKTIN